MKKATLLLLVLLISAKTWAQKDSTNTRTSEGPTDSLKFKVGGFIEVFYSYDFNEPTTGYRQTFFVNHNRHNEFNINLALARFSAEHPRYHAFVDLQAGTYPHDNYAREDQIMKSIYQSYVGVALDKRSRWWVDAGIFLSHLSFESLLGPKNPTTTRLIITENIPYYLSGAKLTFFPAPKWKLMAVMANGWQKIKREPGSSLFYWGTDISYKDPERFSFHWATFFGSDDPDTARRGRYYSNIDVGIPLGKNFRLILLYHQIWQQKTPGSSDYSVLNSTGFILSHSFQKKWRTAFRWEYYNDPDKIITTNPSPEAFNTHGTSINLDRWLYNAIMARIEARWLHSPNKIFPKDDGFIQDNVFVTLSLSAFISKK